MIFRGLPKIGFRRGFSDFILKPSLVNRASQLGLALESLQLKLSSGQNFDVADQKKYSELSDILEQYGKYTSSLEEFKELKKLLDCEEEDQLLKTEAQEELTTLVPKLEQISASLKLKFLPPHPFDSKGCIIEIRPGVGGDEACIFAEDLLNMYIGYAASKRWPYQIVSKTEKEGKGISDATLQIDEPGSYKPIKFERGVHRVQRVPATETKGRTHTSTAAVVVLPKISESINTSDDEREFKPDEIRIDVMRARGKGGQHVNTTDSAVRLTHYPSGIVVSMQDERSQHKNKAKAFAILRARLAEKQEAEKAERERKLRTSQVTTTDRSDKIRTYNFSQNRITDHRCGFSVHDVDSCMNGTKLDEIIDQVEKQYNEERLANYDLEQKKLSAAS